jgi:hypothetical protein
MAAKTGQLLFSNQEKRRGFAMEGSRTGGCHRRLPAPRKNSRHTCDESLSKSQGVNMEKAIRRPVALLPAAALAFASILGCTQPAGTPPAAPDDIAPTVSSTIPADGATNVAINSALSAVFSEAMLKSSIADMTFTAAGAAPVAGVVAYSGSTATFTPGSNFANNTLYTATITTDAKDLAGNALADAKVWTFTTGTNFAQGPAPVLLGTAGNFVILAKSAISTVPTSAVSGDIGVSPAAATYITGFSLVADATNVFATSAQIAGKAYAANFAVPSPSNMTTAISDMETAFTDAAGRPVPTSTEPYGGSIGGHTFAPGLYKWSTGVSMDADVTLSGGPNDVWIFQVAKDLAMASGKKIVLTGGAQAKNVFWQSAGAVALGTTAHMEGIVLSQTSITLGTGATATGRLLAQTAVTLDASTVTGPTL